MQSRLVPGTSLREKHANALSYGFDGIELSRSPMIEAAEEAVRDGVPVSAMCSGHRGWFIDPDPALVRACLRGREAASRAGRGARRAADRRARSTGEPTSCPVLRHGSHAGGGRGAVARRACGRRPTMPRGSAAGSSWRPSTATRTASRSRSPMPSAGSRAMDSPQRAGDGRRVPHEHRGGGPGRRHRGGRRHARRTSISPKRSASSPARATWTSDACSAACIGMGYDGLGVDGVRPVRARRARSCPAAVAFVRDASSRPRAPDA